MHKIHVNWTGVRPSTTWGPMSCGMNRGKDCLKKKAPGNGISSMKRRMGAPRIRPTRHAGGNAGISSTTSRNAPTSRSARIAIRRRESGLTLIDPQARLNHDRHKEDHQAKFRTKGPRPTGAKNVQL